MKNLTEKQLEEMGFIKMNINSPPRVGAILLCYHTIFGLTIGYWMGENCFLFPYKQNEGFNWASHWQYHN